MKTSQLKQFIKETIDEIKVNKPISKKRIIDYFFSEGSLYILSRLTQSKSLDDFMRGNGYNSLDDLLEDDYGLEGYKKDKCKEYIVHYFRLFKENEIRVAYFGDGSELSIRSPIGYKNIEIIYDGGNEYFIYCNNFNFK